MSHRVLNTSGTSLPQPLRVSVVPPCTGFEGNALFEGRRLDASPHRVNVHWQDCFVALYRRAQALGVSLFTSDLLPPEESDVVVFLAPLEAPDQVLQLKRRAPSLRAILVTWESSLGNRYQFNPRNHRGLDAVLTYNPKLVDHKRYYPFHPRGGYEPSRIATGLPFAQRRVGCLIGMHRKRHFNTGINVLRAGWKLSPRDWLDYAFKPGQLFTFRFRVAKACSMFPEGSFDLFGTGWETNPDTSRICRGVPKESTLAYLGRYRFDLTFENHRSDCGLLSERIWDALWGDSVPVYYGHRKIDELVPRECFVDAGEFRDPKDLVSWLCACPEKTWDGYRDAGREFIRSPEIVKWLPEAFAETFLTAIVGVVGSQIENEADRSLGTSSNDED